MIQEKTFINASVDAKFQEQQRKVLQEIQLFRGHILTTVEISVPDHLWHVLRPRLLSLLGDRGLEGAIRNALAIDHEDVARGSK